MGGLPLVIFEARQVMLDNIATTWLLGAFVCATSRRQYLTRHFLAGACFATAILTKETTVIVAPALLFALWIHAYKATRSFSVMASVMMTVLLVALYPLYAVFKSELVSGPGHVLLQDAIAFQLMDRTGSGSVLDTSSVAYDRRSPGCSTTRSFSSLVWPPGSCALRSATSASSACAC